jgi:hypothetical protein
MLDMVKKAGRTAMAAAVALGLASGTVFAGGNPWDDHDVRFHENGQCESIGIKYNNWIENCQYGNKGTVCDYVLQLGNPNKQKQPIIITMTQLHPKWRLYLPTLQFQETLNGYQWKTYKLFRTSIDHPTTPVIVGLDCLLSR